MWMGDVVGELRVANEDTARLLYHELDLILTRIPQRHSSWKEFLLPRAVRFDPLANTAKRSSTIRY